MNGRSVERRGPIEIPWPLGLLILPFLLIGGALSVPWIFGVAAYIRYRERRFVGQMRSANRIMSKAEFMAALNERQGTLIEEWFSEKGPVRYWWTEDAIVAHAPGDCARSGLDAIFDRKHDAFSRWLHEHYLDTGKPLLVWCSYVPELECAELRHRRSEGQITIPIVIVYSGSWIKKIEKQP